MDNTQPLSPYHSVLLIEDDIRLAALICEYLTENGFKVESHHRGDTALEQITRLQPDLIVLDVMLPGLDGFEVCKQARQQYDGPILMMTAKDEDIDQVVGLEIGADDYVVKPIQPRLLLARIRALLRRFVSAEPMQKAPDTLHFGQLSIVRTSRSVTITENPVNLTTNEFDLLWLLASNAGAVLSRDQISEAISGIEYDGLDRSIDIRISRLRKLLNDNAHDPQGIKTIRGKGYLFVAEGWEGEG